MAAGVTEQVPAAGHRHQSRHPVTGGHERIDPLDRRDRRLVRQGGCRGRNGVHPRLQARDNGLRRVACAERRADAADVGPQIVQSGRLAGDDPGFDTGPVADRRLDIGQAGAADFALVLGDDHVGPEVAQQIGVDPVDRQAVPHQILDPAVDFRAGPADVELRGGQHGQLLHAGRIVAFVGPADQIVAAPQGGNDFGGATDQGNDAHGKAALRRSGQGRDWREEPVMASPLSRMKSGAYRGAAGRALSAAP